MAHAHECSQDAGHLEIAAVTDAWNVHLRDSLDAWLQASGMLMLEQIFQWVAKRDSCAIASMDCAAHAKLLTLPLPLAGEPHVEAVHHAMYVHGNQCRTPTCRKKTANYGSWRICSGACEAVMPWTRRMHC